MMFIITDCEALNIDDSVREKLCEMLKSYNIGDSW